MGIIGVSGRMQSGKDTVAAIIQYLIWKDKVEKGEKTSLHYTFEDFKRTSVGVNTTGWKIRKFADKLKDIVCLLIGCTREQLEDREFKSKELGKEWDKFVVRETMSLLPIEYLKIKGIFNTLEEAESFCKKSPHYFTLVESLTPRKLLQLLGTECGRNIIHNNIWVNSLFADYKPIIVQESEERTSSDGGYYSIPNIKEYPNWIITDMRFPNEVKAVKDRGGITIRINRPDFVENALTGEKFPVKVYKQEHESETALDNYKFDYEIQNDGTIAELIDKVEVILKQEKII